MEIIDRIEGPSERDLERGLLQQLAAWKTKRAPALTERTPRGVQVERRFGRRRDASVSLRRKFDSVVA